MWQRDNALMQITFTAAIAFLEKARWCYNWWLHLAIAQSLTFIDLHFAIARTLKSAQFIILLWKQQHHQHRYQQQQKSNKQTNRVINRTIEQLINGKLVESTFLIPLIRWISDGSVSHTSSPRCWPFVVITWKQAINKMTRIDEMAVEWCWSPPIANDVVVRCNFPM